MYSFDVYDTIVTRTVYEPKGIWDLMGFYMLQNNNEWNLNVSFINDFSYLRADSEKQARKNKVQEITIDDIYDVLKYNHNLSDEICIRLKNLEIECELNNTIIIKESIEKIKKLNDDGEHIVLISDMYLPSTFYVTLFDKICPLLNEFRLYLSCEIGFTKSSGLLYKYVSIQEGIRYADWVHEGDNIVSDINVPELYGITTVLYQKQVDLRMIERVALVIANNADTLQQVLLGIVKNMEPTKDKGYRIGYGFAGIALYVYVDWVLKQAKNRHIKHLYFIARDGFVLKKIADVIIYEYGYEVCTHYLYGSRRAWRVESQEKIDILKKYINQEFVDGYSSVALVDTQGTGHSVESLSKLLGEKFVVFYYALFGSMENRDIIPICYTSGVGGSIIEVLCRAPHGSTEEYACKDGRIFPVLKEINETVYLKAQLFSYFDGIVDFSKKFSQIDKKYGGIPKGNVSECIVHYCVKSPDVQLADFIGEIPFDGNNENEQRVYAPKLDRDLIRKIELERTVEKLETVYLGEELDVSYNRLDAGEKEYLKKCQQEYIDKKVEKTDSAIKIVIYGFGKYGKELYHRMYLHRDIKVVDIVDINYQRFADSKLVVNPIKNLRTNIFDIVVISLYDKKISMQIRSMLVSVGIDEKRIMDLKEFEDKYGENNK